MTTSVGHPRRSWLAHLAAGLGLSALLGVLCLHFPDLLTSRDFREVNSEAFACHLLPFGLIAATASTSTADATVTSDTVKNAIRALPVWLQFLLAVLAHANLRLDFGWLEHVLVTPRCHHWHHARQAEYVDANDAIHLPLVDRLMGTFRLPPRGQWPLVYGVMKPESVPRGFRAQARMPLSRRKAWDDCVGREEAD